MAVNINFLAGKEENVQNVPLQQGKVLFAVDHDITGEFVGYIYYDYFDKDLKKIMRIPMGSGGGSTANNPVLSIADMLGNVGDEVATANLTRAVLKLPKIIKAEYLGGALSFMFPGVGDTEYETSKLYKNGLILRDPAQTNKHGWTTLHTGNENTSILELGMIDLQSEDNQSFLNKIVARLYDKNGAIVKEAALLDFDGSSTFPGPIKTETFIGDLRGNADSATYAVNDELGKNISDTYLVTLEDNTLNANTYLIDLITGNGRVSKTIEIPAATPETTGLITATNQSLSGWKTLDGYLIFPWSTSMQKDISFFNDNRLEYDYKPTGLTGYFSEFEDFWQITGSQDSNYTGYMELSVGNTGEESVYLTRYTLDDNQNPMLTEILTLLDKNAGSVLRRLTLIDDDSTIESDLNYGLWVEEDTGLYGNLFTSQSIRLQADRGKDSIYYIVPHEDLMQQYTYAKDDGEYYNKYGKPDVPYYAYLDSLIIQNNLEVNENLFINNTLITKNIVPDLHNEYSIGQGLPDLEKDNYYLNSYISNMYSNRIIVQGLIEESEILEPLSTNPHILFRENNEGAIYNEVFLYYSNYSLGDSYDFDNGLRLTGYNRPYLDVNGAIYSRYDVNGYISLLSDENKHKILLTNCGPQLETQIADLLVDDVKSRLYLQRTVDEQFINIESSENNYTNTILSSRTWSGETTYFKSEVRDGRASLINQVTENIYFKLVSDEGQTNTISISANEDSKVQLINDMMYGMKLRAQLNDTNYIQLFNDETYGYNLLANIKNKVLISRLQEYEYEFEAFFNQNTYGRLFVSEDESTYLQLKNPYDSYINLISGLGRNAYITLENGNNLWSIFTTSSTNNDFPGTLQFKLNNADYSRIIFANDTASGIKIYGSSPYIDFHYQMGLGQTSRIQAIEPFNSNVQGLLSISGQIIIPDNNLTDIGEKGAGIVIIGSPDMYHLALNNNAITAKQGHSMYGPLYLNQNGGRVIVGTDGLTVGTLEYDNTYKLYVDGRAFFSDEIVTKNSISADGNLTILGKTELHQETIIHSNLTITGNIVPSETLVYNLGHDGYRWKNVFAESFYGALHGTADRALIADRLVNSLRIQINDNIYDFTGAQQLTFGFYAPQGPASENMHVLYWDNGAPSWADPNWLVPEPDPEEGMYVRKVGDDMLGQLRVHKDLLFSDIQVQRAQTNMLSIQGQEGAGGPTTLRFISNKGSQLNGVVNLAYDTQHSGIFQIDKTLVLIDGDAGRNSQLRLSDSTSSKAIYFNSKNNAFSMRVTGNNPYTLTQSDLEVFKVDYSTGIIDCPKGLRGAMWNDYAEFRESDELEPGRCVYEVGDDSLTRTTKRLMPGCNIVSDTFGFAQGETDKAKTPIATAGRVLAYTYEHRDSFEPGDAVCSGPNGTVSKMTREEIREWPDRIVGTVSCVPTYEYWGTDNEVKVNGRIWIKVK